MRIAKWIVAAAVAATAMAGDQPKIQVCTSSTVQTGPDIPRAQQIAHTIFEQAGVEIEWVSLKACGADAIRIKVQGNTPEGDHGKAYAYALPYEGHTIVVLYDRIVQGNGRSAAARVLAHVLAHEIGHILEGVARHSETGTLKPTFTAKDRATMARENIGFAPEDVDLIRLGIARRQKAGI